MSKTKKWIYFVAPRVVFLSHIVCTIYAADTQENIKEQSPKSNLIAINWEGGQGYLTIKF